MKKRLGLPALLLAVLLALAACQSPLQETEGELILTREQMQEDLAFFFDTLEQSSPHYPILWRKGLDVNGLEADYMEKLDNLEGASIQEFYTLFAQCLGAFNRTGSVGHISPIAKSSQYIALYQDLKHRSQWHQVLAHPKSMRAYGILEGDNLAQSGPQPTPKARTSATMRILEDDPQIALIRIPTFNHFTIQPDHQPLMDFYAQLGEVQHLIIDITGNGGGDTAYWNDNIASPLARETLTATSHAGAINSPSHLALLKQGVQAPTISKNELERLPAFTGIIQGDLERLDTFYALDYVIQPARDGIPFNGKIWLLVDQYVYSSAESFAHFCKQTGFATLVGRRTGGNGIGIDPAIAMMPNSGLLFRYDMLYGFNTDGSCNDEQGTLPDMEAALGRDLLKVCLQAIQTWDAQHAQ